MDISSENEIVGSNQFSMRACQEFTDRDIPVHYKFRFTFTEQDKTFNYADEKKRWRQIGRGLVRELTELYKITYMTGSLEYLNKKGEHTWGHMHIHFDSIEIKDTIYRKIRNYLRDEWKQEVVGVKYFSLKPEVMRNFQEFFRYPLKQNLDMKMCRGFTEQELQHMHDVARDSYTKVVQINQAKTDKMDSADTMFERLIILLDKTNLVTRNPLIIETLKFYVKENKPINRQVIGGYVDTYMLKKQYISYQDYTSLYFN